MSDVAGERDDTEPSATTGSDWWWPWVPIVSGIGIGVLGRGVPVAIALRFGVGTAEARSCGMEEVLECALENLPDVVGALVGFALALIAASAVFAVVGVGVGVAAAMRRSRGDRGWLPAALLALGAALCTPAVGLLLVLVLLGLGVV